MIEGFVRVAAASPEIRVADCACNAARIEEAARAAAGKGARIIVFPELSITGYTCGDLFLQDALLDDAKSALAWLVARSEGREEVVVVGLPLSVGGKLYNVAAVYSDGELHAFVPKTHLPNYSEFYEMRHFSPAPAGMTYCDFDASPRLDGYDIGDEEEGGGVGALRIRESGGVLSIIGITDSFADDDDEDDLGMEDDGEPFHGDIPFGTDIVFRCDDEPELSFAVEICEDLWAPAPPSARHAANGAAIIANLSAGNETIGKAGYRRLLVQGQSGRLICGYVYANAGLGESTQDMVFSGHSIIAENGTMLAENPPFGSTRGGIVISDIDVRGLAHDRRQNTSFTSQWQGGSGSDEYEEVLFSQPELSFSGHREIAAGGNIIPFTKNDAERKEQLFRRVDPHPFVPQSESERAERCEEILAMQTSGLAKRLSHTRANTAVIGVSGGLDSTLALIVAVRAAQRAGDGNCSVLAATMPSFGTTDKTNANAKKLCAELGVELREIDITPQVREHLKSIGHSEDERDVTYENAQARVRTLVLMDMANQSGGMVVGTGDLSELALGWATYNGDHMSMYGVNAGVPKSLVRHIIKYVSDSERKTRPALADVLDDIIATPVSPELLPPDGDDIAQKTEDIVGPYELHDFFLYHMIRWGRRPRVIMELAKIAFAETGGGDAPAASGPDVSYHGKGAYADSEIKRWLRVFVSRFFANQFKRSTLPDGPKIGSVALSPRGDWRMPSDASAEAWMRDLE
ncbi:MAG: NAD(+) synthase [Clostridiales Family XIII bacterium]|jgi:NAD+ synthase (glutamine-hydrolysing)|nr:NAD(+) synthase [Clostridiales Family XIII bacterium]